MVKAKGYYDLCSSEFIQTILGRYYEHYIDHQLPLIRRGYEERCKAMILAIEEHMPEGGSLTRPTGGFFVWYETLDATFDSLKFVQKAIDNDVSYVPGQAFYPQDGYTVTQDEDLTRCERPTNAMRLGYSLLSSDKIIKGIEILGSLLKKELKSTLLQTSSFTRKKWDDGFMVH